MEVHHRCDFSDRQPRVIAEIEFGAHARENLGPCQHPTRPSEAIRLFHLWPFPVTGFCPGLRVAL